MKMHGIQMHHAGTHMDANGILPADNPKRKLDYPYIHLHNGQAPVEGLEVGKDYEMVAVVHVADKDKHESDKEKDSHNAHLEVRHIGFAPYKKNPENMSDAEQERELQGKLDEVN